MSVLAWHFVADTLRDGSPIPADDEWLVYDGPVVICTSGLHASGDAFDALQFAPGPKLCRVEWDALKMMVRHLRTGDEAIVEGEG